MAEGTALRSIVDALDEVARWKSDEESRHNTELAEVDQEVASLQTGIENLKQQLEALGRFRQELMGKLDSLQTVVSGRNYEAVFSALGAQSTALKARASEVLVKQKAVDAAVMQTLEDPELKNLLAEYEQFKTTVEPTLGAMPASYREAMEGIRDAQRAKLADKLSSVTTAPAESDGEPVVLDILVAVDAPDGQAEVLMLVIPVDEAVNSAWEDRDEDLQTFIAARVLQGAYRATRSLGFAGAEGVCGGHRNMLAIEVELAGGSKNEVAQAIRGAIQTAVDEAPELKAARVSASARIVEVDNLLPPEDAAEVEVVSD